MRWVHYYAPELEKRAGRYQGCPANGWSASNVPLDTISEFKVVLNAYDASYGRAGGGALDALLKTGTNKYHGSLYEFARRPWLDAQSYAYNYAKSQPGQTVPFPTQHKRDQFGLEVHGPARGGGELCASACIPERKFMNICASRTKF